MLKVYLSDFKKCLVLLATIIGGSIFAATLITGSSEANNSLVSNSPDFRCDSRPNQDPTTVYLNFDEENNQLVQYPLITWEASLGNYSPQDRCYTATRKFQELMGASGRQMEWIVSGYVNGQPVVCAARTQSDPCTTETVLFTLRDRDQLDSVRNRLVSILEGKVTYGPVSQSDGSFHLSLITALNEVIPEDNIPFFEID